MHRTTLRAALATALLMALAAPCLAEEHTKDPLDKVKRMVREKKAALLDVREQREWDAGHVEGALFLPLSKIRAGLDPKELAKLLPKDKPIYCHCASGGRCLPAAAVLKKHGYDVRPLKPSYKALIEAGFPKAKE